MKLRHLILGSLFFTAPAFSQTASIQGSDTLAGYISDIIVASGLDKKLVYQGGGSGLGETALVAKTQGLAPMSRAMKPELLTKGQNAGLKIEGYVVGLDGVGLFVNKSNALQSLTIDAVKKIYSCEVTNWNQVGGPNLAITVYRRNDNSGTTDAFKSLVGIKSFGACVKVVAETSDIAAITSSEVTAVGYSGQAAIRPNNRELAIAKDAASRAFLPTPANIRNSSYPLSRSLYVYASVNTLSAAERILLDNILDRSFSDPILQDNNFITVD